MDILGDFSLSQVHEAQEMLMCAQMQASDQVYPALSADYCTSSPFYREVLELLSEPQPGFRLKRADVS